jgi:hypothetical protein
MVLLGIPFDPTSRASEGVARDEARYGGYDLSRFRFTKRFDELASRLAISAGANSAEADRGFANGRPSLARQRNRTMTPNVMSHKYVAKRASRIEIAK